MTVDENGRNGLNSSIGFFAEPSIGPCISAPCRRNKDEIHPEPDDSVRTRLACDGQTLVHPYNISCDCFAATALQAIHRGRRRGKFGPAWRRLWFKLRD